MSKYYQEKMAYHHSAWSAAQDSGDEVLASKHMAEYLNYEELFCISNKKVASNER